MRSWTPAGFASIALAAALTAGSAAHGAVPCTDADATALDPACFAEGSAAHFVRTLCDPLWVPPVCDAVAFGDPGYVGAPPPTTLGDGEFLHAFGAVHEHSSYSDGDPLAIPRDYFRAAKSGVNGVRLDFLMSSEHSDNEKLPITTSARCVQSLQAAMPATVTSDLLLCNHVDDPDHYFKWQATLEQAVEATDLDAEGQYDGFTAIRGFEWTNDIHNHLNVYFSRNVINAKNDGSYLSMDFMWNWLREPVAEGGGADGLVTFNHPGGNPKLSPFDGGLPHTEVLRLLFTGNWNDVAYVPDVDRNVVGMEVNGGDDIDWYVKGLGNGWHIGAVAAEDHHGTTWSSPNQEKTVVLTKGRSPRHYYEALSKRRTYAVLPGAYTAALDATPTFPAVNFWADLENDASSMGARIAVAGPHVLHVEIENGPVGSHVAIVSHSGGLAAPVPLGTIGVGPFSASTPVMAPTTGEGWWFVLVHDGDLSRGCQVVTAPIWIGPGA